MKTELQKEKEELRHSILRSLYRLQKVCLFVYDREDQLLEQVGQKEGEIAFLPDAKLREESRAETRRVNKPCLHLDADRFLYGVFEDVERNLYLCGPVSISEDISGLKYEFQVRYGRSADEVKIPYKSYTEMSNLLAALYMCIEQQKIEDTEIMTVTDEKIFRENPPIAEELVLYNYKRSFDEKQRYGQQREDSYCKIVEKGDVETFLATYNTDESALEKVGDFAKNGRKKLEYMFVSALILTRVSAVRGGMDYLTACDLSDLYMRRLEVCERSEEILLLLYKMRLDYITRVQELKKSRKKNAYVEFCKDEISRNITKPFSRGELAEKLGLNAEYLSALFKEKEGMTLSEYRTKARMEAASNLLKYSWYSISDIAERLMFSSSSSFGKYFKEEYHMTPSEYRNQNQRTRYDEDD